jgi:hypothetical protein
MDNRRGGQRSSCIDMARQRYRPGAQSALRHLAVAIAASAAAIGLLATGLVVAPQWPLFG